MLRGVGGGAWRPAEARRAAPEWPGPSGGQRRLSGDVRSFTPGDPGRVYFRVGTWLELKKNDSTKRYSGSVR